MKKLVLTVLVLFGFGASMLYLQNRATNPKYLVPVEVRITVTAQLQRVPEFLKLNITNDYDDAKETFAEKGLEYTFSSSRVMKSLAVRLADRAEVNKISSIQISMGDRTYTYDSDGIPARWGLRSEKDTVLLELRDRLQYSRSKLSLLSSKYSVMNWPGDRALLSRFFTDKPWIFLLDFSLLLISLAAIFLEEPLRRFYAVEAGIRPASPWLRSLATFCLLFGLSLLIRFPTLTQTTSMDEGTFVAIGDRVAKGAVLYRDVWDPKSPGFFFYYSILLSLFHSLFMVKLIGLVVTSFTALVLSRILGRLAGGKSRSLPILAGVTYILVSSIADPNFCINPEQLVVLFSGLAILAVLRDRPFTICLSGLFLGVSFITKYPAGLDFAAVGLLWIVLSLRKGRRLLDLLLPAALAVAGFLVPFLAVTLYAVVSGSLHTFVSDNLLFDLTSYSKRMTAFGVFNNIELFARYFWPFALVGLIGFVCMVRSRPLRKIVFVAGIWGLSSLATILLPSQKNMNYWFQLWGAISLVVPFGVVEILRWFGDTPASPSRFSSALTVVGLVMVLLVTASAWMQFLRDNYPLEIAQAISTRIAPQDKVFVLPPSAQVDYFYLDRMPPSRYVHGFDRPDAEMQRVFDLEPRFVVTAEDYDFKQQWAGEFDAYRLFYRAGSFEVFERSRG